MLLLKSIILYRHSVPLPRKNDRVFGTVSCFKRQKNLFDLLQAFKTVQALYPATRLEIIGDGAQRTEIEQWLHRNNLAEVVLLHGWQDTVAPHMRTWNSFVLTPCGKAYPVHWWKLVY